MSIVTRATLHRGASNTYYGQWPREKAAVCCIESPANAHNGLAASAGLRAVDARARDFPGNRALVRRKFTFRPKEKAANALPAVREMRGQVLSLVIGRVLINT